MTDQTTIFKAIKSDFEQRIGAEERLGKMDRLLPVQKKKRKKNGVFLIRKMIFVEGHDLHICMCIIS